MSDTRKYLNKKHNNRKKLKKQNIANKATENNKRFIKNLSDHQMSTDEINLLSKGLKFIPTPLTDLNRMRKQLLSDFNQFARRMRLQYIFNSEEKYTPFM